MPGPVDDFRRMAGPMMNAIKGMLGRGVITLIQEATKVRTLQLDLMADETADDVEHFQDYGFTSRPFPGGEAILLFPGGARSHAVVIATEDRRYRLTTLDEGEVALYDDQGQVVHLKRDGILIKTTTGKVTIEADGDVSVKAGGTLSLESDGNATIKAPNILLDGNVDLGGTGGAKLARVGDPVAGGVISGPGAAKAKAP